MSELEKQHHDANQLGIYEAELRQIERQFKAVDREQHQLLQWALKDFPADQVEAENRNILVYTIGGVWQNSSGPQISNYAVSISA